MPSCNGVTTVPTFIYLADDPKGSGYYAFEKFPGVCDADVRKATTVTQPLTLEQEIYGNSSGYITSFVSITIKNTGDTTWSGSTFQLAPIEGRSIGVPLGASESIAPQQTRVFELPITVPSTEGFERFQWRMKQGDEWFGHPTAVTTVHVIDLLAVPPCPLPAKNCAIP